MAAEISTRLLPGPLRRGHRQVRFSTRTVPSPQALDLATADDVFLVVGDGERMDGTRSSLPRLRAVARDLPWAGALAGLRQLRPGADWRAFTVSASALGRRNYSRYEVEDHVAEGAAAVLGLPYRPTRAPVPGGPELAVRVHLEGAEAMFGLRVFDRPLHRRAYKQRSCPGTLHPPLAAAMAMVAGLRPGARVLDPFAGVGTIAIEALRLQPLAVVAAADVDLTRVADIGANARAAGVALALAGADGAHLPWKDGAFDRVVSNVPWQRAVPVRGQLAHSPAARDREIARVLDRGGRAVLLVHRDDPLGRAGRRGGPLALLHRSWVSVSGQHPRLCILAREGAGEGGVIDEAAPWGPPLAREIGNADTIEAVDGCLLPGGCCSRA